MGRHSPEPQAASRPALLTRRPEAFGSEEAVSLRTYFTTTGPFLSPWGWVMAEPG